jgi:hypothetical protein
MTYGIECSALEQRYSGAGCFSLIPVEYTIRKVIAVVDDVVDSSSTITDQLMYNMTWSCGLTGLVKCRSSR